MERAEALRAQGRLQFDADITVQVAAIVAGLVGAFGAAWYTARKPGGSQENARSEDIHQQNPIVGVVPSHKDEVIARGSLRIGAVKHPPLSDFRFSDGSYRCSGLYVEMAREACRRLGLRAKIEPIEWQAMQDAFEGKRLDVVVSVFTTHRRVATADFVAPFHTISMSGVARADDDRISHVSDLRSGRIRVVVTKGEAGWELAEELKIPRHCLIVTESPDLADMMALVQAGRADVGLVDELTAAQVSLTNPNFKRILNDSTLGILRNAIMVPKGDPEFAEWIDEAFTQAREDVAIKAIEKSVLNEWTGIIRSFR